MICVSKIHASGNNINGRNSIHFRNEFRNIVVFQPLLDEEWIHALWNIRKYEHTLPLQGLCYKLLRKLSPL